MQDVTTWAMVSEIVLFDLISGGYKKPTPLKVIKWALVIGLVVLTVKGKIHETKGTERI